MLRRDRVLDKLEVVPDSDVEEDHPLRRRGKPGTSGANAARCSACGDKLNRSRFTSDKRAKSCPKCSAVHGLQHVFRPYPEDFGTAPGRESEANPDGPQSHCATCRAKLPPDFRASGVRLCSGLT